MKSSNDLSASFLTASHLSIAAAFTVNLALQAIGAAVFWRAGRAQALTVGLLSGNRNLALLLAVLVDRAEFDVLLFFAVGQFPIFVLPAVLAPVYRRIAQGAPLDASAAGRS